MKLWDVPRNSKIRVLQNPLIPPRAPTVAIDDVLEFIHIDGMYSLCYNQDKEIVHIAGWTEVEIVD